MYMRMAWHGISFRAAGYLDKQLIVFFILDFFSIRFCFSNYTAAPAAAPSHKQFGPRAKIPSKKNAPVRV